MRWTGSPQEPTAGAARRTPVRLLAAIGLSLLGSAAALLPAPVLGQQDAERQPFVITADTRIYDTERDAVTARGSVDITTGERQLLADEVIYRKTQGKMFAKGNVVLLEPSGDALFG